jgi:hypothetical protein
MNRNIINKEIESLIKSLQTNKIPESDTFTDEVKKIFKGMNINPQLSPQD